MANLYGKIATIATEAKTGTVVISNPTHATISANKMSGFVGETITLSSSTDTNYIISYYTVNGSKITSNRFMLAEGTNTVSAVVAYVEPSVESTFTLTCKYFKDNVEDTSLSETYTYSRGRIISPDNYKISISGYSFSECDTQNSFPIYSNTEIKYYYIEVVEIDPFDYITCQLVQNGSESLSGYLRFSLQSTAPFDGVNISTVSGEAYYNAIEYGQISASGVISKSSSIITNEWTYAGEIVYYKIILQTTFNGKTYRRDYTYGTMPEPREYTITLVYQLLTGAPATTVEVKRDEGTSIDVSALVEANCPSDYMINSIDTDDFIVVGNRTIIITIEPEPVTEQLNNAQISLVGTYSGYCIYRFSNPNGVTVTIYINGVSNGTISANSYKDIRLNGTNAITNSATYYLSASGYLSSDVDTVYYVPSSGSTVTYHTLTCKYSPSAAVLVSGTLTYRIEDGERVDPDDYYQPPVEGYKYLSCSPSSTFTMSSDRTITYSYGVDELEPEEPDTYTLTCVYSPSKAVLGSSRETYELAAGTYINVSSYQKSAASGYKFDNCSSGNFYLHGDTTITFFYSASGIDIDPQG